MSSVFVWIVVGGVAGGLASLILRPELPRDTALNIGVGIVGALITGAVLSPLVGAPGANDNVFSVGAIVVSLVGSIILLVVVNVIRRGRDRR